MPLRSRLPVGGVRWGGKDTLIPAEEGTSKPSRGRQDGDQVKGERAETKAQLLQQTRGPFTRIDTDTEAEKTPRLKAPLFFLLSRGLVSVRSQSMRHERQPFLLGLED